MSLRRIHRAMEQVKDRSIGQRGEPSDMLQVIDPRSNGIGSRGDRATSIIADLGSIRSKFHPIVDERTKTSQGPDHTEERDVTKLPNESAGSLIPQTDQA